MLKGKKENEVLKECLDVLKSMGIFHWRQNTGSFRTQNGGFFRSSMPGVSDILGIMPDGRFFAVECKREHGGVVSDAQKFFLYAIQRNHGVAIVCSNAQYLRARLKIEMATHEAQADTIDRLMRELEDYE